MGKKSTRALIVIFANVARIPAVPSAGRKKKKVPVGQGADSGMGALKKSKQKGV
jgi:hypothetical protein